jgi:crotonobetainyl-CoA:carnitine CoA-transferase CaiB-like acyl-CoA transferase
MSVTGIPGIPPVRTGVPIGDLAAGMFAAIGILAALLQREATGRGQHVDVAMLDSQISLLSYLAVYFLVSGEVPTPQGRGHVSIPTYRSFTCADGVDLVVAANTERMWRGLCEVLGRPDLAEEVRFATNELRLTNRDALWPILEAAFRERSAEDWLVRLRDHSVPAAQVNTVDLALASAQARHRNMSVTVRHPDGTPLRLLGNPIKLSATDDGAFRWPPELGEHTEDVLRELLGLSADQVAALVATGVVATTRPAAP